MRAVSPMSSPVADAARTGAGDSRWTDGMAGFLLTGQGMGVGLSIIPPYLRGQAVCGPQLFGFGRGESF